MTTVVELPHPAAVAADPVFASAPQRLQGATAAEIGAAVRAIVSTEGEGVNNAAVRHRGSGYLLDYLGRRDGDTWQRRWESSPLEAIGPAAFPEAICEALGMHPSAARRWAATSGLGALVSLDVVRPSLGFLYGARLPHTWSRLPAWRNDPHADVLGRVTCTDQTRARAVGILGRLLVVTGRPVAELTAEDLLAWREAVLARHHQAVGLAHLWLCLTDAGILEGSLEQALRRGRKSVAELVDRYDIASRRVRNLLVAYLGERATSIDYSSLKALVVNLCLLFWCEVERISPGIETLDLPPEVAARWKEELRWRTDHRGRRVPRRGALDTLMAVRGFYADLIQLAHAEPGRWAEWACRPPVSEGELKAYRKRRLALRSEMHERTRARAGLVGELFGVGDGTWQRVDGATHAMAHPEIVSVGADGALGDRHLDMVFEEEDAFWGLAVVEVLRHTGIRIEEMLELTQLDLHTYDHPDPAVGQVLLLHISPSKQDRERMVVVAPELAAVLAAMARRIRAAVGATGTALPSLVAYDHAECVDTEPLPFLFQRTAGRGFKGTTRRMQQTYVGRVLDKVVEAAGLRGPDGAPIRFTAHDSRRVFATDALAAGLPPHIIQKLMGHACLHTTQGYAAIFPDDVIRSHRAFIENRRALRPSEEYREVSAAEWEEFEEHFAKRKIAIGDCMRAYGMSCVHEYACEQCRLAHPDAGAEPRLRRTRQGLEE